jgi:hypothetical protein
MTTPYTAAASSPALDHSTPSSTQWQEQPRNGTQESSTFRSVTPAMNNTRGAVRNASPGPSTYPSRGVSPGAAQAAAGATTSDVRAGTPSRYLGAFNSPDATQQNQQKQPPQHPASTGLIRLTLRKPMGIVFEPMYDPNSPSVQRGVRICDLPRTGAAALSRKLEVGDELLSINDKTMSRLTFDEIMDFIIEADPEEVNLLFRRPRKETLNARHGAKAVNPNSSSGVKWVDDDTRKKQKDKKKQAVERKPGDKKTTRKPKNKDDDETLQSEDVDYRSRNKKKGRGRKDPYESESFLDILIDTICANPDNVCRDRRRTADDEYYSDDEDDGTFASRDDSTYVTYESDDQGIKKKEKAKSKGQKRDDDSSYEETEEDTIEDKKRKKKRDKDSNRLSPPKEATKRSATPEKKKVEKYEDDGTLETVESTDRPKPVDPEPKVTPPLGLAPHPNPEPTGPTGASDTDDDGKPAPIRELEYDDQVDHGADVSVMESLGGPSLLIEKQRQAAIIATKAAVSAVPPEIIENFGNGYPIDFGFSLEQSIQNDPLRFYTHIVKGLLQEHEPEKVRLLDKLLAKYKGREDHLVQKLSVRYNKEEEEEVNPTVPEDDHDEHDDNFENAVKKGKDSATASAAIKTAKERLHSVDHEFSPTEWPDKETKEPEEEDQASMGEEEEGGSETASEYSGESIDGTSPAVIAQVSELLNYVYGKTSVPGQIDRVSTIMRAYEGREAVLLELLETKALIKANREKENAGNLPSFLRNSANAQRNLENELAANGDAPPVTPMATQNQGVGDAAINDDISSMSGVSSPAAEGQQAAVSLGVLKQISVSPKKW